MKISVVVPVYNAENSIERCVQSILNQSYSNIELICVDDGSKDASWHILSKLVEEDSRMKAIHTENCGVSAARNLGLSQASGDYVGFVDSDDYIEPQMYARLAAAASTHHADVV